MTPAMARAEVAAARAMGWYATTWDTIGTGRKNGSAAPQVAAQSKPEGDLRRAILLQSGGVNIIAEWARNYGDYVSPADRAPMTERKRELIEGSRSEAQQEAAALAEIIKDSEFPKALLIKDVVGWVRSAVQGRVFDTDYELRRAMAESGVRPWGKRVKVAGRLQYAMVNDALFDLCQRADDPLAVIRDHVVKPEEVMGATM